ITVVTTAPKSRAARGTGPAPCRASAPTPERVPMAVRRKSSMMSKPGLWLCVVAGLALVGSGSRLPGAQAAEQLPEAARSPSTYVLAAEDVLEISVQPQQGYDRTLTIRPDGKLVFPVVGELTAAGMTVQQ